MNAKPARISSYLGHIHEAIERIETYIPGMTAEQFGSNRMVQDAVIRNLEIIGEASRNILKIDPQFEQNHPDVERHRLIRCAMRSRMAISASILRWCGARSQTTCQS